MCTVTEELMTVILHFFRAQWHILCGMTDIFVMLRIADKHTICHLSTCHAAYQSNTSINLLLQKHTVRKQRVRGKMKVVKLYLVSS